MKEFISVFYVRGEDDFGLGSNRELIEKLPLTPASSILKGQRVTVDLSGINQRMRGPKIVGVDVQDGPSKRISVNRVRGRGYQTVGSDLRICIETPTLGFLYRGYKVLK